MGRLLLLVLSALVASTAPVVRAQPWSRHLPSLLAVEQLRIGDGPERLAAARTLAVRGDEATARAALVEALRVEHDPSVRVAIAEALGRRAHPALTETLARGLAAAGSDEAEAFADALARVGTVGALGHLVDALSRDDVRRVVVAALERVGLPAAPLLMARLREHPGFVPAIEIIGIIGDLSAVPLLCRIAAEAHPPPVRLAALRALGRLRDSRAAATLRGLLDTLESGPAVAALRAAALEALAEVGDARDAPRFIALLEVSGPEGRRAALDALCRVDPESAAAALRDEVMADDPRRVRLGADVALARPHPSFVPILHGLLREGARADEAATALAELGEPGVVALLREGGSSGSRRELAVALRHARGLRSALRDEALALLRREGELEWRGVARDPEVLAPLRDALEDESPSTRARAAQALGALGNPDALDALVAALAREDDADTWSVIATTLALAEVSVEPTLWLGAFERDDLAPAAALLAAHANLEGAASRRRGSGLRRLLSALDPAARANAAYALGALRSATAMRALLDHETDPDPAVRRAVAWALAALRGEPVIASRGRASLRFRVAGSGEESWSVDVTLADGRTLRCQTSRAGEAVVSDLAAQTAEVRVRTP